MRKANMSFRKRVLLAISLVTLVHIVALAYFFINYQTSLQLMIIITILAITWLIILNTFLTYLLKLHQKSHIALTQIKNTELGDELSVKSEVESLDSMVNLLSLKVRSSFEELSAMGTKINGLNQELAKKMGVLLTIMQIHEIFAQGLAEDTIFQMIVDKLREVLKLNQTLLVLTKPEAKGKGYMTFLSGETITAQEILKNDCFTPLSDLKHLLILDKTNYPEDFSSIKSAFGLDNIFINPLRLHDDLKGFLLGASAKDNFSLSQEDLDLIELLSKNILLVWEHKRLSNAVDNLEIYDPLTGLYNKNHVKNRLQEEIKRSVMYQRPCGLLVAKATNLKQCQDDIGTIETEKILKRVAKIFKDSLRPIDIPSRLEEDTLVAILIERNKRQCQQVITDLKKAFGENLKKHAFKINFIFSIAENPIDGNTAEDLFNRAFDNLKQDEIQEKDN